MSDYGNYSSDDNSSDDIGLPKTPGAPLNAPHSDSDEEEDHGKNRSDSSRSDDDDEDEVNKEQENNKSRRQSDKEDEDSSASENNKSSSEQGKSSDSDDDDSDSRKQMKRKSKKRQKDSDDEEEEEEEDNVRQRASSDSEEEQSHRATKRRKTAIESSDDDEEEGEENDTEKGPKAEDLFGELSDEDDDETNKREKPKEVPERQVESDEDDDDGRNNAASSAMNEIFGDVDDERANNDMDEEEAPLPETRIEVDIPRCTANLGDKIHFVKLPNFLSVDTHPYDPQWYEDEIDEDEVHDDEGRARLKLKVENTIRWRNTVKDDGQIQKESNARMVQWDDGSMSLHLGDEIFDMQTLNLLPGENNHLFIRQGTGLQGQSVFKTKLTFRPFSTESFTHRKLTLSLADRSQKTQKICVLPNVGKDPEAHRSEMIKKEEVKLKASIRNENKPRRIKDRGYLRGLSNSVLDEDEDDESISISKIKNQFKRGPNYSSNRAQDSDEEDSALDDSDLDIFEKKKNVEKRKIVVSDDDDDDDD